MLSKKLNSGCQKWYIVHNKSIYSFDKHNFCIKHCAFGINNCILVPQIILSVSKIVHIASTILVLSSQIVQVASTLVDMLTKKLNSRCQKGYIVHNKSIYSVDKHNFCSKDCAFGINNCILVSQIILSVTNIEHFASNNIVLASQIVQVASTLVNMLSNKLSSGCQKCYIVHNKSIYNSDKA